MGMRQAATEIASMTYLPIQEDWAIKYRIFSQSLGRELSPGCPSPLVLQQIRCAGPEIADFQRAVPGSLCVNYSKYVYKSIRPTEGQKLAAATEGGCHVASRFKTGEERN
jgi:hypothetical protein